VALGGFRQCSHPALSSRIRYDATVSRRRTLGLPAARSSARSRAVCIASQAHAVPTPAASSRTARFGVTRVLMQHPTQGDPGDTKSRRCRFVVYSRVDGIKVKGPFAPRPCAFRLVGQQQYGQWHDGAKEAFDLAGPRPRRPD